MTREVEEYPVGCGVGYQLYLHKIYDVLGSIRQKVTNFIYFLKFLCANLTGLGRIKVTDFICILQYEHCQAPEQNSSMMIRTVAHEVDLRKWHQKSGTKTLQTTGYQHNKEGVRHSAN